MQRELVKWIQSLDLSFPLKNPRRDLANGFLVAEILSRYDKDVSLHSFDTGCSMKRKFDNWQQIQKILSRRKCKTITEDDVAGALQSRPEAARILLEKLYTHVTHKELKPAVIPTVAEEPDAALPVYARKTAVALLRTRNDETADRLAELTGKKDLLTKLKVNDEMLLNHHVQWKAYRLTETQHFKPEPRPPASSARGTRSGSANKTSGSGSDGEGKTAKGRQKQTVTKEMVVKGVDDTVCEIFAQRDEIEKEEAFRAGFDLDCDLGYSLSRVCYQPLRGFGVLHELEQTDDEHTPFHRGRSPRQDDGELSDDVTPRGDDSNAGAYTNRSDRHDSTSNSPGGVTDSFSRFIANRQHIPLEAKQATWRALQDAARNTAKLVVHRLEEFAHLTMEFGFLFTPSNVRNDQDDFDDAFDREQILTFLQFVGRQTVQLSSDVGLQIVERYLLPLFSATLSIASPAKFAGMLATCLSYLNASLLDDIKLVISRVQVLLEATGGSARFVTAVYHLLSGVDFAYCFGADALCQYYATVGMSSSQYQARVAGLLLAEILAQGHFDLATVLLPSIKRLAEDPQWEVRAAVLDVASVMAAIADRTLTEAEEAGVLPSGADAEGGFRAMPAPPGDDTNDTDSPHRQALNKAQQNLPVLHDIITTAFQSFAMSNGSHRKLSLRLLAPHLQVADDTLLALFIARLMQFPLEVRAALLATSGAAGTEKRPLEAIPGAVRPSYVIGGLAEVWYAPAVAEGLLLSKDKYSTFEILSVFEPLILSADLISNRDLWLTVLGAMKNEILSAIYDPGSLRGVSDPKEIAYCAEMATAATTKYYADLSGEVIDESSGFQEIQQIAVEWLQSSI